MYAQVEKPKENKSRVVANAVTQKKINTKQGFGFLDNRPEAVKQRKLQEIARNYSTSQPIQQKENNFSLIYRNTKSISSPPIQRAKDVQEMRGVDGFRYEDIVSWDGTPCVHHGVSFISDVNVPFMNANNQTMVVRYNPIQIGQMSPPSRYFLILHELGHIYYQHPGNTHPDSVENEIQADDSALVNAVTLYPEESPGVINDFSALLQYMIDHGQLGGGTHPLNADRKLRIEKLFNAILNSAILNVKYSSNWIPKPQMDQFLMNNGDALMMDPGDIKTFTIGDNLFSYVDGGGQPTLRIFLQWLLQFRRRNNLIPNFNFTHNWIIRPFQIQNNAKDILLRL